MRTVRRAAPLAAVAFVVVLVACEPAKSPAPGAPSLPFSSAHPIAQELYHHANDERAAHGLGGVGWNDQLGGLAQNWSNHMAATGQFGHQNLDAILNSPAYGHFSAMGENILRGGCGLSAAEIHQAWMNSPGHRAHILGGYNAVGIGVTCNGGTLYATQNFAR